MAIELKTDEGKLDPLQEYNLNKIAKAGGISIVCNPSNMMKTYDFLSEIAKEAERQYKENTIFQ